MALFALDLAELRHDCGKIFANYEAFVRYIVAYLCWFSRSKIILKGGKLP